MSGIPVDYFEVDETLYAWRAHSRACTKLQLKTGLRKHAVSDAERTKRKEKDMFEPT